MVYTRASWARECVLMEAEQLIREERERANNVADGDSINRNNNNADTNKHNARNDNANADVTNDDNITMNDYKNDDINGDVNNLNKRNNNKNSPNVGENHFPQASTSEGKPAATAANDGALSKDLSKEDQGEPAENLDEQEPPAKKARKITGLNIPEHLIPSASASKPVTFTAPKQMRDTPQNLRGPMHGDPNQTHGKKKNSTWVEELLAANGNPPVIVPGKDGKGLRGQVYENFDMPTDGKRRQVWVEDYPWAIPANYVAPEPMIDAAQGQNVTENLHPSASISKPVAFATPEQMRDTAQGQNVAENPHPSAITSKPITFTAPKQMKDTPQDLRGPMHGDPNQTHGKKKNSTWVEELLAANGNPPVIVPGKDGKGLRGQVYENFDMPTDGKRRQVWVEDYPWAIPANYVAPEPMIDAAQGQNVTEHLHPSASISKPAAFAGPEQMRDTAQGQDVAENPHPSFSISKPAAFTTPKQIGDTEQGLNVAENLHPSSSISKPVAFTTPEQIRDTPQGLRGPIYGDFDLPHGMKSGYSPANVDNIVVASDAPQREELFRDRTPNVGKHLLSSASESKPTKKASKTKLSAANSIPSDPSAMILAKTVEKPAASCIPHDPRTKSLARKTKNNPYGLTPGVSPFPLWPVPTPKQATEICEILTETHGKCEPPVISLPSLEVAGCGEVPSVLDALLRTLLSGATTMKNANSAIQGLYTKFGKYKGTVNWHNVRMANIEDIAQAIFSGGLASTKAGHIKKILFQVHEEDMNRRKSQASPASDTKIQEGQVAFVSNAELEEERVEPEYLDAYNLLVSLDYILGMPAHEAMQHFTKFDGIGVKTASCVMLFCLRMPSMAVDTHVYRMSRWLGWIPPTCTRDEAFSHLDVQVPDKLKYALHQLFIRHGQTCLRCSGRANSKSYGWDECICPLEVHLSRDGEFKERHKLAKKHRDSEIDVDFAEGSEEA